MEKEAQWRYLKQFLLDLETIGKSGWLPDSAASCCPKCQKPFTFTLRRHHCRICGNIFCKDHCYNRPINVAKEIRNIRVCETCNSLLKSFTSSLEQTMSEKNYKNKVSAMKRNMVSFVGDFQLDDVVEEEKSLVQKPVSMDMKRLELMSSQRLREICKQLSEEHKVPEMYQESLENMVMQAVSTVKPSVTIKDSMNFLEYVKVKTMPNKDFSATKYVNGVVFAKNVADKKMKTDILNPSILIVSGELSESKDEIQIDTFREILNKEGHFESRIMKAIAAINPSVIVVERSVAVPLVDALRQQNITLFCNVKPHIIKKIARLTGTVPCPSADLLSRHLPLGHCKRVVVETALRTGKEMIAQVDTSYCYFEGCIESLGCTLCIGGKDAEILKNVKRALKRMLILGRDVALETKYLDTLNVDWSVVQRKTYLVDELGMELFLKSNYIEFTKLYIHKGEASSDMPGESEITKKGRRLCGSPQKFKLECYTNNDYPFGEFISSIINIMHETCPMCSRKRFTHEIVFVHAGGKIKIEVQPNNVEDLKQSEGIIVKGFCKRCQRPATKTRHMGELYEYSLARFMMGYFYSSSNFNRSIGPEQCNHGIIQDMTREFYNKDGVVTVEYEASKIYDLVHSLLIQESFPNISRGASVEPNNIDQSRKFLNNYVQLSISQYEKCRLILTDSIILSESEKLKEYLNELLLSLSEYEKKLSIQYKEFFQREEEKKGPTLLVEPEPFNLNYKLVNPFVLKHKTILVNIHTLVEQLIKLFEPYKLQCEPGRRENFQKFDDISKALLAERVVFLTSFDSIFTFLTLKERGYKSGRSVGSRRDLSSLEKDYGFIISNVLRSKEYKEIISEILRRNENEDCVETLESELLAGYNYGIQFLFPSGGSDHGATVTVFKNHEKCEFHKEEEKKNPKIEHLPEKVVKDDELEKILTQIVGSRQEIDRMNMFLKVSGRESTYSRHSEDVHDEVSRILKRNKEEENSANVESVTLFVYCANQFSALRGMLGLEESDFINSVEKTKPWDISGGKTNAEFRITDDSRFIFKCIKKKEKEMFLRTIPQYFKHMCKSITHHMPSVLIKFLGFYKLKFGKEKSREIILMENLYYGFTHTVAYDLKGSERRRYIKREGRKPNQVLLDTNFKQDYHGNPLVLNEESAVYLSEGIHNDSLFLSKINVCDYSLVLLINEPEDQIKASIIDYLREYNTAETIEYVTKKIIDRGNEPTVIDPSSYKRRFREAMRKYFVPASTLMK